MPRISNARENILLAARELFWNNSYEAVGVEAICQQAGVKKGSFYHFFESKETVALTLLDQLHQASIEVMLTPAFAADIPARARFDRFLAILDHFDAQTQLRCDEARFPGCPMGNMILELSTQSESLRLKLEMILATYIDHFTSALEAAKQEGALPPDADSRALGQIIAAAWQGGILIAKARNDSSISVQIFRQALEQIFGTTLRVAEPVPRVAGT